MGFSISWLAIKAASADEACAALGLARAGGNSPYPDYTYSGAALPTGWYLVVGADEGYPALLGKDMQGLSQTHDIVVCEVEEHVMFSSSACWMGGTRTWSVIHDCDKGPNHLETEGTLPDDYEAIKSEVLAEQEEEDDDDDEVDFVFEVPLELAKRLAGFKHDEVEVDGQEVSFEELRPAG
ncbi:MAG: hypothetical protein IMF08_09995 [Proteobacteria bacterium]|nr:hypothetical protein [Pseudomonadota bacterium]MCK4869039.1 hypothetical protein [Alphaproteobacteria bacterium]